MSQPDLGAETTEIGNAGYNTEDMAANFQRAISDFYNQLDQNVGGDGETGKVWFGRRAQEAKNSAYAKQDIFNQMKKVLDDVAAKIYVIKGGWEKYENSGRG